MITEYFYPDEPAEPTESTRTFLAGMRDAGLNVSLVDGAVRVVASNGVLTDIRRDRIAKHASALVTLLGGEQ